MQHLRAIVLSDYFFLALIGIKGRGLLGVGRTQTPVVVDIIFCQGSYMSPRRIEIHAISR